MEYNNKEKIRRNLPNLVETTICSNVFLAYFTSKDIFCKSDEEIIKVEQRNGGDTAAASKFYDVIVTKTGAFEVLLQALRKTNQTGVLNLLDVEYEDKNDEEQEKVPLKFVKSPDYLGEFTTQNDKNILVVVSEDCEITCEWILETAQNCKLFKKENITELESLKKDNVAVVNIGESPDTLHFVAKNYGNKALLVTSISLEDKTFVSLKTPMNNCMFRPDNIKWNNLAMTEKDKIVTGLKGSLSIDGTCLTDVLEKCDTKLIVSLIRGRFPLPHELFSDTIPSPISYYITRTLVTRNIISKEIFQNSADFGSIRDIFLFSNIERHTLSQLANKKLTDTSGNILKSKQIHTSFVILEHDNHYYDICKSFSDKSVHNLRYDGDNFVWIRSSGNMSKVQKCVSNKQCNVDETKFLGEILNQQHSLICISDTPGMGKSILLVHMAAKLKEAHNNGIVAFALISELVSSIRKKIDGCSLCAATTSAIFEHVSNSKLGHAYLQVNTSFIRELLLDGLDEIDPDEMDFALNCIKEIKSVFRDTRIWITTRPHVLHTLENEFSILGYNIAPFTYQDQISFLTSFWSSRINRQDGSQRLAEFAKHCLTTLKSSLSLGEQDIKDSQQRFVYPFPCSNIRKDKYQVENDNTGISAILVDDIAGVPLQCLLVGEVYEEDAKVVVQENATKIPTVHLEIRSVPDLYLKMIDKKFTNFKNRYDKIDICDSEISIAHMQISVQQLFPAIYIEFSDKLSHTLSMQQILDVGIIEAQNVLSSPRFIHRTFAEYFIANFIAKMVFKSKNKENISFLNSNIFKTQTYAFQIQKFGFISLRFDQIVIARFLNAFLEKIDVRQHQLLNDYEDFKDLSNVLTASLHNNFENIFNCFLHYAGRQPQFNENFFTNETLVQAVYWASIPLLKTVTREYTSIKATPIDEINILTLVYGQELYLRRLTVYDSDDNNSSVESSSDKDNLSIDDKDIDIDKVANQSSDPSLTLLHIAVHRGDFATVEFLLTNYFLDSVRDNIARKYDNILHVCVAQSITNSDRKIAERTQVIKNLGSINPSLFTIQNDKGLYPIECKEIHNKLVLELWKTGKILYKKHAVLSKILFNLLDSLKLEFTLFIKTIFEDIGPTLFQKICSENHLCNSFLMQVISSKAGNIELLNFLKTCSATFCLAKDKVSVFKVEVDKLDGAFFAKWLVQNVNFTNDEFKTVLLYSFKKESHFAIDAILVHLKYNLVINEINFLEVFDFIFEEPKVASTKNPKVLMKLLSHFATIMILSKPVNEDYIIHLGTKPVYFLQKNPSDLDLYIKYGIVRLTLLEARKRINCVESYFLKCIWISDKVNYLKNFAEKCRNYLGHPDFLVSRNGSTLLDLTAKYFCDDKISVTFLLLYKVRDIYLNEEMFFFLVNFISLHERLDFWIILISTYGKGLVINMSIDQLTPFCLTTTEYMEAPVMAVLNSQVYLQRQGVSTILNIQRIVYIVIKKQVLNLIKKVCAWCIRSCPSPKMAFSEMKVFFNSTAYTLLDAAIESLNGDVLHYVYTVLKCKVSLIPKIKIPLYIHGCLSSIKFEVTSTIRYVKLLAIIFPNDIEYFVNQQNDNCLVPLSLPLLDKRLVSILVKLGANVNFRDGNENTPLHCALLHDADISMVMELVKLGADVNVENKCEDTPLFASVKSRSVPKLNDILFMTETNLNLTKTDSDGNTIVHLLASKMFSDKGFRNLVQCLISKKVLYLLQVPNYFNKTPLQLVEERINISSTTKNILMTHRMVV